MKTDRDFLDGIYRKARNLEPTHLSYPYDLLPKRSRKWLYKQVIPVMIVSVILLSSPFVYQSISSYLKPTDSQIRTISDQQSALELANGVYEFDVIEVNKQWSLSLVSSYQTDLSNNEYEIINDYPWEDHLNSSVLVLITNEAMDVYEWKESIQEFQNSQGDSITRAELIRK